MPVAGSLADIPSNIKQPLFYLTVDGSQAGLSTQREPALLTGQMLMGQASSAPKGGGNTGTGTLALDAMTPVLSGAVAGVYTVKFTSATAFTVRDPSSNVVGTGAVGSPFANALKFSIAAGGTAFIANDEFDITVARVQPTAPLNVQIAVGSANNAAALFGYGSMLHRMAVAFFLIAPNHELWMMAVADPSAGNASTGSITVTTAPTTAGTIPLYLAGQNVNVQANGTDTAAQLATKIAAAINAATALPVTAVVDGTNPAKVNTTCRWPGLTGNDIVLTDCYYGSIGGEVLPAGLVLTYAQHTGGTGSPDFTSAIPAMGESERDYVGLPYTDAVTLALWEIEYGFTQSGRWGWQRQLYGGIFSGRRGAYNDLLTFSATRNAPQTSIMSWEQMTLAPTWELVAAYTALAADNLLDDPACPLHTLEFTGLLPAKLSDRFNFNQREALANAGLAIQVVGPDGAAQIQREQTTYQFNQYGQSDDAFELVTTQFTNARLFRRFKSAITSKYGRCKLADDGTAFGASQKIVTPSIIKAEILSEYQGAVTDGLAENYAAFKANLVVIRDPDIPTRVNVIYPPDLVNGLRTFAALAQFRLQYGRGAS